MDDSDGLDTWLTQFDGFTRDTLAGLVRDGLARYDVARAAWIVHLDPAEPFEVRDVAAARLPDRAEDATRAVPGAAGEDHDRVTDPAARDRLDAEIDQATNRYEARRPPASVRDGIIYRALAEADASPGGTSAAWRDRLMEQLETDAPREWYEVTYAAGDPSRQPVLAYDEEAALHTGRRMSGTGEQVNVTHVTGDGPGGTRRLTGSFRDRQPLSPAPARPANPWLAVPPPRPDHVPSVADVAGPPVLLQPGDPRGTARQFPGGISPLPVAAASSGPARPARLLHPDGDPLDCRPDGRDGPVWTATAAGVVPAEGDLAPGWLQVVSRDDGSRVALHPALVSPRGVNPYVWLPYRQQKRFSAFDTAEAAGRPAALLAATFVDPGDRIRAGNGDIHEVTEVTRDSDSDAWITTTGRGGAISQPYGSRDLVEVIIPARHPAEDTPDATRLFAIPSRAPGHGPDPLPRRVPAPPARPGSSLDYLSFAEGDIGDLRRAMGFLRSQGEADGPGTRAPGQPGWQASVTMTGAMQRAQDHAAGAISGLSHTRPWRRLRALTADSRRLAADVSAGRLRFGDPAVALRTWRAVWARACEVTCDLAAMMMDGVRQGSSPWYAARALHHTAAEGIAHARSWLPREMRLPMGSYEPPGSRRVSAASGRMKADAAARLHEAGAGPLSQLDFPGPLQGVTPRAAPTGRDRQRAARTAAARPGQASARSPRPGPR